jgi:hypothetical protein
VESTTLASLNINGLNYVSYAVLLGIEEEITSEPEPMVIIAGKL